MDPLQICIGASLTSNALHQTPNALKSGQGLAWAFPVSNALHWCSGVVRNGQEFPHFYGQVRVKKLVQENRIRIGTWNVGFVTGKLMEIVDTMTRSRINIVCLQKTKWVGEKSRKIEHVEYILWYTRRDKKYK
jgi:hypothetical protein